MTKLIDTVKVNIVSLLGFIFGGLIRRVVYGPSKPTTMIQTIQDVEREQVKKFRNLIAHHYTRTPFGREAIQKLPTIDYWANKLAELGLDSRNGIKPTDLERLITSIKDIENFPTIPRSDIEQRPLDMVVDGIDPKKLQQINTSGTTSDSQVVVYRATRDMLLMIFTPLETFKLVGVKATDKVIWLYPKQSSIWKLNGVQQLVIPRLRFLDCHEDNINEKKVKELLSASSIGSYANVPVQIFNQYHELVKKYKEQGKIKIKCILLSGDYVSDANYKRLHELLGEHVLIAKPLASMEFGGFTTTCSKGHTHVLVDSHHVWIHPETEEIIGTCLYPASMIYPNYQTGDMGKLHYMTDCELTHSPTVEFVARLRKGEVHKHFGEASLKESIDGSLAFRENLIKAEYGATTYIEEAPSFKRVFDVYIVKGARCAEAIRNSELDPYDRPENSALLAKMGKYIGTQTPTIETLIEAELRYRMLEENLYIVGQYSNWKYNFHLIGSESEERKQFVLNKLKIRVAPN